MALGEQVVRRIISQFRRPRGFLGRIAGWEMALRSSNRERNRWAVDLLDVQPDDRVLEIGFGPGIAIKELSRRAVSGSVVGVDHSDTMVRQARRRNGKAVRRGGVELLLGSAENLPRFGCSFDKILSVNSIMFWDEPVERLKELRGLLTEGGVIAIVRQPRGPGSSKATKDGVARETEELLRAAGFEELRWESLDLKPPVVCVLGRRASFSRR